MCFLEKKFSWGEWLPFFRTLKRDALNVFVSKSLRKSQTQHRDTCTHTYTHTATHSIYLLTGTHIKNAAQGHVLTFLITRLSERVRASVCVRECVLQPWPLMALLWQRPFVSFMVSSGRVLIFSSGLQSYLLQLVLWFPLLFIYLFTFEAVICWSVFAPKSMQPGRGQCTFRMYIAAMQQIKCTGSCCRVNDIENRKEAPRISWLNLTKKTIWWIC